MIGHDVRRVLTASAAIVLPGIACATGAEMAGLALVGPLLIALAVVALVGLAGLAYAVLPTTWARRKRVLVALGVAPLAGGLFVLLLSGGGLLQMLLARLLA